MSDVLVIKGSIEEDTNPTFFARLTNAYGVALQVADVNPSGVTMFVYDLSSDDPNAAILTVSSLNPSTSYGSPAVALMTDAMRTGGWDRDSIGYQFTYTADLSSLYSTGMYGGRKLRVEFEFLLAVGGKVWANYELTVRSQKSS